MFKKPKRYVKEVFLHVSASDNLAHDDISVITEWHLLRNFRGVGYHYFVTSQGKRQLGRDLERPSAAQAGHNSNAIAICTHGNSPDKFTNAQLAEVKKLCHEINDAYEGKIRFRGHCEVTEKPIVTGKQIAIALEL